MYLWEFVFLVDYISQGVSEVELRKSYGAVDTGTTVLPNTNLRFVNRSISLFCHIIRTFIKNI